MQITLKPLPDNTHKLERYRPVGAWRPSPQELAAFVRSKWPGATYKTHRYDNDSVTLVVMREVQS